MGPLCGQSLDMCPCRGEAQVRNQFNLSKLGIGHTYLLLAHEAGVVASALRIGVDVGVAILGGAAAAAPGIGSGGVISPRIVIRHLRLSGKMLEHKTSCEYNRDFHGNNE